MKVFTVCSVVSPCTICLSLETLPLRVYPETYRPDWFSLTASNIPIDADINELFNRSCEGN